LKLNDFEYELLKFIKKTSMIEKGDRVMLAVSGGSDSVAMMYALSKIKEHLGSEFFVAHLNHMIRPEAVFEGEGVQKMAKECGMDCFVESRNVPEYIKNHKGLSLEEGARIVRYEFFEELALKHNANKIATAHHLSDLTENFFLRLFRGSGIGGLVGMSPVNGKYIKPFLVFDEQNIRKYVKINRLEFFEDKTNFDTNYLRNRIRHVLVPKIKAEFCQNIEESVLNTSQILKKYQEHVDKEVELYFKNSTEKAGYTCFDLKDIQKADDLILSELFKMVFKKMDLYISNRKINSCVNMILKKGNGELNLGKGIYFSKNGKVVCFGAKKENSFEWKESLELSVPGEVKIRELSVKIYSELKMVGTDFGDGKNSVTLEAEKVKFPLVVRPLSESEKIVPFGMKKEVRVRDILKNHHVYYELRKTFPVVSQIDGKILWVVGITFPDDLKITGKTRRILSLIREGGVF